MNNQAFLSLWYVRALIILALVGVVASLASYTKLTLREAKYGQYGMTSISVRGEGEVFAKPDIGSFTFSVNAEGADAATAQNDSAKKINDIISSLQGAGVEEKDIKTQGYSLNPKYRYEPAGCPVGMYCPNNQVIDGYEVSQTVSVKVRDLDKAGSLITGVGELGATNISSLSFTIDDESSLKAEARELAIADAQAKADKLAKELGVKFVRITSYYEEDSYNPYGYASGDAMMSAREANVAPSLPTGENKTKSVVNITFEVR